MSREDASTRLHALRGWLQTRQADVLSDGSLLARFVAERDEAAFATLVRRHGPLVYHAARRVLADAHEAEDVFQATFLVLARRAAALERRPSLANWLYTVAVRIARKVSAASRRREALEQRSPSPTPRDLLSELTARELLAILDEELLRLPPGYQAPLVLCYLQGKSREEAARELAWTPGAVKGRLERGRELLRQRLARRGVALPAALCTGLVLSGRSAALPVVLVRATVRAAVGFTSCEAGGVVPASVAALVRSALQSFSWANGRLGAALLMFAAVLGVSAGALMQVPSKAELPVGRTSPGEKTEPVARTDRYGDPLPPGALRRLGTTRFRHGWGLQAIAYSPDGRTIASAGTGGHINLWESATGRRRDTLHGHGSQVFALTFAADGQQLLSAGIEPDNNPPNGGGRIILWNLRERRPSFSFESGSWFQAVAMSNDGRHIAAASEGGELLLLDRRGKVRHTLGKAGRLSNTAALSPDGRLLAAAGDDPAVNFWDVESGKVKSQLSTSGVLRRVAFSPDGRLLATANDSPKPGSTLPDTTLHIWDLASGKERHALHGPNGFVLSIAFSPDGKMLASGWMQGRILLWDVERGTRLRELRELEGWFQSLAFSPDGKTLAAASSDGRIQMWNPATGNEHFTFDEHSAGVFSLALSADGRTLVTAGQDGSIRVWDAATGRTNRLLRGPGRGSYMARTTPDGALLVSAGFDGTVRLWNAATGKQLRQLTSHEADSIVAISPDGRYIATGGHDHRIRLWDAGSFTELRELRGHEGYICNLAFSPDGNLLASLGSNFGDDKGLHQDGTVRIWDVARGVEIHRFPKMDPAMGHAFAPEGQTIVCLVEGRMHCRHALTGKERPVLPLKDLLAFAFSPDGCWLGTAHKDGTIRVRERWSGQEVLRYQAPPGGAHSLLWSADGRVLISANSDMTVLIWDLAPARQEQDGPPSEAKRLAGAWDDLRAADAVRAYRAAWTFATTGDAAVTFLRSRLRPVPAAATERVRQLVADLDHDQFAIREAASRELTVLGEQAEPELARVLARHPSPEVRRRATALIDRLGEKDTRPGPDDLQLARAVSVLERIGTTDTRALLVELAGGAAAARQTQDAQRALNRLARRSSQSP